MDPDVLFACVPVRDLASASAWYELLLGRPPDIVVHENEVMWRIVGPAWLYLTVEPQRAGSTVVSMAVADLESVVTDLTARGAAIARRETIEGAGRKAWLADPDGNQLAIIEVFPSDAG